MVKYSNFCVNIWIHDILIIIIGRNFYEILRAFDALQLTTYHKVVTPVNWCVGQDVFVSNTIDNEVASAVLQKGFVEIKPWFRLTGVPENTSV